MMVLGAACLPMDLEPVEPPAPAVNRPPRIVEAAVVPQEAVIRPDPATGCSIELWTKVVVDEDVDDELQARWFLNYDPTPGVTNPTYAPTTLPRTGKPERVGPQFPFNARDHRAGLYAVDVVVSDGFANGQLREPAPGQFSVGYRWVIDTRQTDCPTATTLGGGQ